MAKALDLASLSDRALLGSIAATRRALARDPDPTLSATCHTLLVELTRELETRCACGRLPPAAVDFARDDEPWVTYSA